MHRVLHGEQGGAGDAGDEGGGGGRQGDVRRPLGRLRGDQLVPVPDGGGMAEALNSTPWILSLD